jgi:hypothetical protein
VRGALADGAVAEEAETDPAVTAVLAGEGHTGRQRQVAADDAVATQEVRLGVEEVHRAAKAFAATGLLGEQLGHDGPGRHPLGVGLTVVPVGGHDVVVRLDRRDRTDRHRLLTYIEVEEPTDLALRIRLGRRLLDPADRQHLPVVLEEFGLLLALKDFLFDAAHSLSGKRSRFPD